jgi:hypothetical protein
MMAVGLGRFAWSHFRTRQHIESADLPRLKIDGRVPTSLSRDIREGVGTTDSW